MAKIETVDYKDLAAKAKQIRTHAQTLNNELNQAYDSIRDMHKSWYGVRYNELAKSFNNLSPSIEEILKITVGEIPFALETIANNFSLADTRTNTTSAENTLHKKLSVIETPNDIGMRFMSAEVETTRNKVSKNFKNSVTEMNTIESIYKSITWRSESADAFLIKFTKLKKQIQEELDNINNQFVRLMEQTQQDIDTTEASNTVK